MNLSRSVHPPPGRQRRSSPCRSCWPGALAYSFLPVSPLPQVDFPMISVSASLPGASPETIASSVATPLERALGSDRGRERDHLGQLAELDPTSTSSSPSTRTSTTPPATCRPRSTRPACCSRAGCPRNPAYRKVNPSPRRSWPSRSPPTPRSPASSTTWRPRARAEARAGDRRRRRGQSAAGRSRPFRVQSNPTLSRTTGSASTTCGAHRGANLLRPEGAIDDGRPRVAGAGERSARLARRSTSRSSSATSTARPCASATWRRSPTPSRTAQRGFHNDRPAVLLMVSRQPGANIISTMDAIKASSPAPRAPSGDARPCAS